MLFRLAYHDFYLLEKYINLNHIDIKKYKESRNKLNIILYSNRKKFEFFYDISSIDKKHKINKTNMMKYVGDPIEKMIKFFLNNKNNFFFKNQIHSTFSIKLISWLKENINKKHL